MGLGRGAQRLGEHRVVVGVATEPGQLEMKQFRRLRTSSRAERDDLEAIVAGRAHIEAAHRLVVLEEVRAGREAGADLVDGERRAALQDRKLFVGLLDLIECLDELLLDAARAAAKALNAPAP